MYQLLKCQDSYFSLALEFYLRLLFPYEYSETQYYEVTRTSATNVGPNLLRIKKYGD